MNTHNRKRLQALVIPWRLYVVVGVSTLFFLILVFRALTLQVVEPDNLRQQADMRTLRTVTYENQRGLILDRHGEVLAASVPLHAIWVDPKRILEQADWAENQRWAILAKALHQKPQQLIRKIKKHSKRRFLYLKRQVNPALTNYIMGLNLRGVHWQNESKRFYPGGESIAQLVGVTNIDGHGIEGLEKSYNTALNTQPKKQKIRKSRDGHVVEYLSVDQKGRLANDVVLSIDQRIQSLAYAELKKATQIHQATSASVVVLDIKTGEVLAMANTPSFNPNDSKQRQSYRMRNRAITDAYEPGSVVKPFVLVAGLEAGIIDKDSLISTSPGYMTIQGKRIKDSRNLGLIGLESILQKSSNVGVTKIALSMPIQQLLNTYTALGAGDPTGVALHGESSGILRFRSRWTDLERSTLSFGYGFTLTTLQLTRMYATLANKGVMMPVTITKVGDVIPQGEQVISPEVAQTVLPMLRGVTADHGTARQGHIDGYVVAGKTGTSRKAVAGGYGDDYVVSFVGVAPLNDPKLAIGVVVNEPKGDDYYGGTVAAPVFSKIMSSSLQLLNVPQDDVEYRRYVKNNNKSQVKI